MARSRVDETLISIGERDCGLFRTGSPGFPILLKVADCRCGIRLTPAFQQRSISLHCPTVQDRPARAQVAPFPFRFSPLNRRMQARWLPSVQVFFRCALLCRFRPSPSLSDYFRNTFLAKMGKIGCGRKHRCTAYIHGM